jgi:hypothetical protein
VDQLDQLVQPLLVQLESQDQQDLLAHLVLLVQKVLLVQQGQPQPMPQ